MAKKETPFNNPFAAAGRDLKKKLAAEREAAERAAAEAKTPRPPPRAAEPAAEDDESEPGLAMFHRIVSGVERLGPDPRGLVVPPPPPPNADHVRIHDEETEVLTELAALIDGSGRFDISDSDEFVEGCIEGLDRRILRKLRSGHYSVEAHVDLHGLTRDPARAAVERFIDESRQRGRRCVLIIHGRGLNSKDNIPVLKMLVASWLERGRLGRNILAFCTARPHDGGAGAVYVLLRR